MNDETFRVQIKSELQKMSKEEIVYFSWISAVRALPFIGVRGNFDYWDKNDRKKYLYELFQTLDIIIYNYYNPNINTFANSVAWDTRIIIETEASNVIKIYANVINNAYLVTYAFSIGYALNVAIATVKTANATDHSYYQYKEEMKNIILTDLKDIQKGQIISYNNLKWYEKIWENFQKALNEENCLYWGNLYQHFFEHSFELNGKDKALLLRRINIPTEIQEQGASYVADYMEELEIGAKHLNESRIIILGEKGAGKTCLARKLIDPNAPMTREEESTAGVETTLWKPEQDDINVHIWDFAGHTVTHAVHRFFLSERCLYILVYDGRTEERNRMEYWLNHVKDYGGDTKVFILINKRDPHTPNIPINRLKENYPIAGFYTFSIKDDIDQLEDFRKNVVEYIKDNPSWSNLMIPTNFFNVKQELEQYFAGNDKKDFIDINEFKRIAKKNKINDSEWLLKSLHALGICLRYKDLEDFDTYVLNPEWISFGIYKIINWIYEQKKYSISITEFSTVFKDDIERYPDGKFSFLFNLMKRYELAYETEKGGHLIIPHLLHEDRPEILPEFPISESLMLRYQTTDQPLPPNPISRFIVRHNENIKKEGKEFIVWRYGVILEDGKGSIALVRELKEERMITVCVKGLDKTNYLNKLRETLNEIFNSYKSKKPELQYRIERFGQLPDVIEDKNPIWLQDKKIYNHYINGRPYYDADTGSDIPMQNIVKIYNITTENLIIGEQEKAIIIGGQGNSVYFLSDDLQQEIKNIIPQITEEISNVLASEQKEIIAASLQEITNQLNNKQPKVPIIGSCFRAIQSILYGAAGSIIANPVLLDSINTLIQKLGS